VRKISVGVVASFALIATGFMMPATASADEPEAMTTLTWRVYGAWDRSQNATTGATSGQRLAATGAVLQLVYNGSPLEDADGNPYTCTVVGTSNACTFEVPTAVLTKLVPNAGNTISLTVEVAPEASAKWSIPSVLPASSRTIGNPVGSNYASSSSVSVQLEMANPLLPPGACATSGLNVAIVADLSQSMGVNQPGSPIISLQASANAFIETLAGSDSKVGFFTFGSASPASSGDNRNQPGPFGLKTPTEIAAAHAIVNGWTVPSNARTDWDAAMRAVAKSNVTYDLVIFITDGNPNHVVNNNETDPPVLATANVASSNAVKAKGSRVLVMYVGTSAELSADRVTRITEISGPNGDDENILQSDYVTATDWSTFNAQLISLAKEACETITVVYVDESSGYKIVRQDIVFGDLEPGDTVNFDDKAAFDNIPKGYQLVEVRPYSFAAGSIDKVDSNEQWMLKRKSSLSKFNLEVADVPMVIYVILAHKYGPAAELVKVNCTVRYWFASDDGEIAASIPDFDDDTSLFTTWTEILDLATGKTVRYEATAADYADEEGNTNVDSPPLIGYTPNLFTVSAALSETSVVELPTCTKDVLYRPRTNQGPPDQDPKGDGPTASTGGSVSTMPLVGQSVGLLAILAGAVMLIRRRGAIA